MKKGQTNRYYVQKIWNEVEHVHFYGVTQIAHQPGVSEHSLCTAQWEILVRFGWRSL